MRARRLIGGAHRQIRRERDHARRQARQDHRQSRAFRLHGLLAAASLLARPGQTLGHVVERGHQKAELVARRQRQLRVVVALGHRAGAGDQVLDRLHQALRRKERAVNRRDQRHQHDKGQNQHEGRFERLSQLHQVRILGIGALHGVGELTQLLRHRIQRDQHARGRVARSASSWRRGADHIPALRIGVQADIRPAAAYLQHHLVGRGHRQGIHGPIGAGGDDLGLRAHHGEFQGGAVAALAVERADQVEVRQARQLVGDHLGVLQELAHTHLERRVRQLARVLQALAHLQLEPTVDAAIEELQREVIHHQNRRHRERAEDRHRAALEARTRHVPAKVLHQARQLRRQQHHQSQQTRDVDEQNPRQPAVEFRGILRGGSQQVERDQPQHHAYGAEHGRAVFANYGCSVHVYQSLSRCHSLCQNISRRRLNGTLP